MTVTATSLVGSLPGEYYTSGEVFAAEQAAIFSKMWVCALRAADLADPGSWKTVKVAGENLVLLRGSDGQIRAFYNTCRHRGSQLCSGDSGSTKRTLRCPYHAWTYDLEGRLLTAPNMAQMPDIDKGDLGLLSVHSRQWLGYVWVCLEDEPPDFEATVISQVTDRLGTPEMVEHWATEDLQVGRRIVYDVKANWKLIVDNFMECYHCATIHPELVAVLPEFRQGFAAQYYVGHGALFAEGAEGFTVDGREGFERLERLDDDKDRRYFALTIKPQVFLNLVPDHVILHRMFPLAPDRTIVECDWLFAPGVVDSGADTEASVELFHRVNEQDFEACEACQPQMSSRSYLKGGGVLVPSEHHLADFHNWVIERVQTIQDMEVGQ